MQRLKDFITQHVGIDNSHNNPLLFIERMNQRSLENIYSRSERFTEIDADCEDSLHLIEDKIDISIQSNMANKNNRTNRITGLVKMKEEISSVSKRARRVRMLAFAVKEFWPCSKTGRVFLIRDSYKVGNNNSDYFKNAISLESHEKNSPQKSTGAIITVSQEGIARNICNC